MNVIFVFFENADKLFVERQKEQIDLFRHYAHMETGPYINSDELDRIDCLIEYYAMQEYRPMGFTPIHEQHRRNWIKIK